jgi:6,7-dimethyl-8-ribityllumazine synthase
MSANGHLPASYSPTTDHTATRIALVTATWHAQVVEDLYRTAAAELERLGIAPDRQERLSVPGTFEIPLAARWAIGRVDAVLCFGCVIQGETRHNEYINQSVFTALQSLMLGSSKPVLNGILTTDTLDQALARVHGPKGYKGIECAQAALQLIDLQRAQAAKGRQPMGLRLD